MLMYSHHMFICLLMHAAEEMMVPWDSKGCHQRHGVDQFTECPNCGHGKIDWFKKNEIEARNKVWKRQHKKAKAEYDKQTEAGKKPKTKPTLKQDALQIRCCCHQIHHSAYSSTCTNCVDGSCELCLCSCSFVYKTTNFPIVKAARIEESRPRSSTNLDTARAFLLGAEVVKEASKLSAKEYYDDMANAGKLVHDKAQIQRAVSQQASLAKAHHLVNHPPSHRQRMELLGPMKKLEHPKGPSWINENGTDRNLAGTGAKSRVINNRLKDVDKLAEEVLGDGDDDDDEVVVVEDRKPAAKSSPKKRAAEESPTPVDTSKGKVQRMKRQCQKKVRYDVDIDDLAPDEKAEQKKQTKALRYYSKSIREGTCGDIVDMVDDGEDEWSAGESQEMHQKFVNIRGYDE